MSQNSHHQMNEVTQPQQQQQQQQQQHLVASAVNEGNEIMANDSPSSSSYPAPKKAAFVHKLYAMLQDPNLKNLIWWTNGPEVGTFALQPGADFAQALTRYFKHGNVASFVRQLHMYGFHKVCDQPSNSNNGSQLSSVEDTNQAVWEFIHSNGLFKRGDTSSLALIKRRTSSNTAKMKSDLNRSLSATPTSTMDMSYQQPGAYYYSYPQYSAGPVPGPIPGHAGAPAYQMAVAQGPPPGVPQQTIIYYPVPHRYSNAGGVAVQAVPGPPPPPVSQHPHQQQQQQQYQPQVIQQQQQQQAPSVPPPPQQIPQQQVPQMPQHGYQPTVQQIPNPPATPPFHDPGFTPQYVQQYHPSQPQQNVYPQQPPYQQPPHPPPAPQAAPPPATFYPPSSVTQPQTQPSQALPPQHQQVELVQSTSGYPIQHHQQQQQQQQQHHHPQQAPQQQHLVPAEQTKQMTSPSMANQSTTTQLHQQGSRSVTPHGSYAYEPQQPPPINTYIDRINHTSKDLMHNQSLLRAKSEILHDDLGELSRDTMRGAETIPSVKSSLSEAQKPEYHSRIDSLKSSISARGEKYEEEDGWSSRSHQASIVSNSSQVSFYENSSSRPRIPSMFVDPLAPAPAPAPTSTPSTLHQHSSSSAQLHPSGAQETGHSPSSSSKRPSVNHFNHSEPSGQPFWKRSGSHPAMGTTSPVQARLHERPLRSIPDERLLHPSSSSSSLTGVSSSTTIPGAGSNSTLTTATGKEAQQHDSHHQEIGTSNNRVAAGTAVAGSPAPSGSSADAAHPPRTNSLNSIVNSGTRGSLTHGPGHLHSQIRPSLVEFHRTSSPIANGSSIASSVNSNSIFSNKASMSSVSSSVRNSIGQLLNDENPPSSIHHTKTTETSTSEHQKSITSTSTTVATTSAPAVGSPKQSQGADSYKPQPYTPKQFDHPVGALRNNSTVSPKSARSSFLSSKTSSATAMTLPPITSDTIKRSSEDVAAIDHDSKKPRIDEQSK